MPTSQAFLASTALFGILGDHEHRAILKRSFSQRFPASTVLYEAGQPASFLFCMMDGQAERFAEVGGRRSSLGFAEQGDVWPLAAVMSEETTLGAATTTRDSDILMIPAAIVRSLNRASPDFARAAVTALSGQYRAVVRKLHNRNMRSAKERLAAFLIAHAARSGCEIPFSLHSSKRALASVINIAPEMLNRCLRSLEPHGVTYTYRTITVSDIRGLEQVIVPHAVTDDWSVGSQGATSG